MCLTLRLSVRFAERATQDDTVFIVFNRDRQEASVKLPKIREHHHWVRAIDTAATDIFAVCELDDTRITVSGHSVVAAVSKLNEQTE